MLIAVWMPHKASWLISDPVVLTNNCLREEPPTNREVRAEPNSTGVRVDLSDYPNSTEVGIQLIWFGPDGYAGGMGAGMPSSEFAGKDSVFFHYTFKDSEDSSPVNLSNIALLVYPYVIQGNELVVGGPYTYYMGKHPTLVWQEKQTPPTSRAYRIS